MTRSLNHLLPFARHGIARLHLRLRQTLLMLAACLLASGAGAANPTYGVHGMALFGGQDALYISHLPMFHAPHDVQLIARVRVADPGLDAELRRRLDGKTALWTVSPEKFELDRLAPDAGAPLRQFRADLVLGHFEQDGKTEYTGATVVVEQVLMYRRLSPAASVSATATYVQLGAGAQRFLVKQIDSRPDFDHIVAYRAAGNAATSAATVDKHALRQPDAEALAAALGVAPAGITGTVYFYTDDLR